MDKVIEDLEWQLTFAFLTDSTQVHIDRDEGMFILERLKEIRDKWYEGGGVDESNDKSTDEG